MAVEIYSEEQHDSRLRAIQDEREVSSCLTYCSKYFGEYFSIIF